MLKFLRILNRWLIVKVSHGFSTTACVWLFVVYGLLPLLRVFHPYQDTFLYWSNYIQLVALPLLAVGQKLMAKQMSREVSKTVQREMMQMQRSMQKGERRDAY